MINMLRCILHCTVSCFLGFTTPKVLPPAVCQLSLVLLTTGPCLCSVTLLPICTVLQQESFHFYRFMTAIQ